MRLYFQKQGSRFPLVLLHGFLGSSDNWRAMGRRLAERFTVYAVDLRNHGQSPHSEIMNYPAMAADVCEFLDAQGIATAHLLGHSMGGKVAMCCANEYPERLEKLVVVDIAARLYASLHRPILTAMAALDLNTVHSFGDADAGLAPAIADSALRQFLVKNLARRDNGTFTWKIGLDEISANYDRLGEAVALPRIFPSPACFIRGARSRYVSDADMEELQRNFPNGEFHTIEDAGHWVHIDSPEEFFKIVTDFLTKK